MLYPILRLVHLLGLALMDAGLIGAWYADLRARKVRDLSTRERERARQEPPPTFPYVTDVARRCASKRLPRRRRASVLKAFSKRAPGARPHLPVPKVCAAFRVRAGLCPLEAYDPRHRRSEEHTSELQS